MNPLQSRVLDLFRDFVRACQALDIPYFLICGSALGAVKYGGFIPWDDDMDVGLLRPDYERFLREGPARLPGYVFLQNYRTDPAFPAIYTKLRDTRTGYAEPGDAKLPICHGAFLDVFPLDGYPAAPRAQRRLERRKRWYRRLLACGFSVERPFPANLSCGFLRLLGCHRRTAAIAARYEAMIAAFPVAGSEIIANHGGWQGWAEYAPAWHYGAGAAGVFQGFPVRLPERWDAYLRQKYGDYTRDPPEAARRNHGLTEVSE